MNQAVADILNNVLGDRVISGLSKGLVIKWGLCRTWLVTCGHCSSHSSSDLQWMSEFFTNHDFLLNADQQQWAESSEASNDVVITQRETNWCPSSHCLALKASFVLFIFLPTDNILWNLLSQSLIYILYTDTVYLVVHLLTYTACFIYTILPVQKEHRYIHVSARFKTNVCAKISIFRCGFKQNDRMQSIY